MSAHSRPMADLSGNYRKTTYDLFVGNMPLTINDAILTDSFSKFGPIASVQIRDGNRQGTKIGYVRFLSKESLDHAAAGTVYVNSTRLHCSPAFRSGKEKTQGGSGNNANVGTVDDYTGRKNPVTAGSGNKPDIVSFSHSEGTPRLIQNNSRILPPSQRKKHVRLFMTHVESPCVFWAQNPEQAEVIANVERSMASICPMARPIMMKPEPKKVYGSEFSFDQQWYRCELNQWVSESQSEVLYVDYGNKEVVDNNKIVELPECLMQLDPLASKFCLYGIGSVDDPVLFARGVEKLSMLKEATVLDAVLYEPLNGVTPVKLKTMDGIDVIQEMLGSKACVPLTDPDARQINPKELTPQVGSVPSHPRLLPKRDERQIRISGGSGDHAFMGSTENLVREVMASRENLLQVLEREAKVSSDLQACQKQNVEYEEEIRSLKSQILELNVKMSSAVSSMLPKKLARIFAGLRNVMLQRVELQSAADAADPVAEAITMATSSSVQTSPDEVPVLGQIDDVRARYRALQTKLITASEDAQGHDLDALDRLISERNDARNELFARLQDFINLFSDVDGLTSHEMQIEKLLATLEVKYASYLASPVSTDVDLDECSEAYLAWKNERQQKFEDARRMTDFAGSLALKSVEKLREELLHRSSSVDLTEPWIPDLDHLFEDYESTVDTELKLYNQEASATDVTVIQRMSLSLTSELHRRLENVRKVIKLRTQFVDECEELRQWLNESPDVSRLQSTAKTIKTLKSKLRHRLADLQDMQEDEWKDTKELVLVENDLAEIRCQLQQQLEIEDEQMKWFSVLTLNHFPEMIVRHPELNLKDFIKFDGLLKSGHLLDQFQLQPLHGQTKKGVHKSTYCGKPVILKEFIIELQSKASQSDFLKNVKEYSEIMSPHLIQLMAVFFGMNDRQAVIVLPYYEFSLTQLVEDNASGFLVNKQEVLGSVLHGLSALHGLGLVHGAIHPNNILVNESAGDVVIADYNFAKTPVQRSEDPFVTSSGLKFQAPELQLGLAGCQPSFPADMYNFGLLILWLYEPQMAAVPNSFPDLPSTSMANDMATLVACLLEPLPDRRPKTEMIIAVGYFSSNETEEESNVADVTDEDASPSKSDDVCISVDFHDVKTESHLEEAVAKDVVTDGEEGQRSVDEQRIPESGEAPKKLSEDNYVVTECCLKLDISCAEGGEC